MSDRSGYEDRLKLFEGERVNNIVCFNRRYEADNGMFLTDIVPFYHPHYWIYGVNKLPIVKGLGTMTDKVYVALSELHGIGVFAGRDFASGDHVLQIDDSRVVNEDNPLREELGEYPYHCDYLSDSRVVLMQSPERHINHSCDPNTYVKTIDGVRVVIALRSISANTEITYDYAINGIDGVPWSCRCGAERCRGAETWADYFRLPREVQIEYRPLLDDWFVRQYSDRIAALNLPEG